MRKFSSLLVGLLALAAPAVARENWPGMKPGLTPGQTLTLLGRPLVQNQGHGYEVWFFDHEGEVTLYHGRVLYWTEPKVDPTVPGSAAEAIAATKKPAAPAAILVQDKRPVAGPARVRPRA